MDLFQAYLFRGGGGRVFVERAPVTGEGQLLVDIEVLIPEDLHPSCSGGVQVQGHGDHSHTTPRSATRSDLARHNLSGGCP